MLPKFGVKLQDQSRFASKLINTKQNSIYKYLLYCTISSEYPKQSGITTKTVHKATIKPNPILFK